MGGITLTRNHQKLDFHRLPLIKGLHLVVMYPRTLIATKKQILTNLTNKIEVKRAIQQSANLGAFVQALYTSNLDLLSRTLSDKIGEDYWSTLIPCFRELKADALNNGALGFNITGAGPAIFALCKNSLEAEKAAKSMGDIYKTNKIRNTIVISKIDHEGVIVA